MAVKVSEVIIAACDDVKGLPILYQSADHIISNQLIWSYFERRGKVLMVPLEFSCENSFTTASQCIRAVGFSSCFSIIILDFSFIILLLLLLF